MLAALALLLAAPPQPPAARLLSDQFAARVLVPAYVFPDPEKGSAGRKFWDALIAGADTDCPVVAIINPASGPIDRKTPEMEPGRVRAYTDLITRAAANKHLHFVMYVPLANNATKKIGTQVEYAVRADANDDIDAWLKHYPPEKHPNLVGFFLDEHPAFDKEQIAEARKVREYAAKKLPGGPVFLNLGRADGGAAVLTADLPNEVAVLWEYPEKRNPRDSFALPAWADEKSKGAYVFPRHRFAALVHSKPKFDAGFVALMSDPPPKGKRVGWVYVTDRELAADRHPWDALPAYWGELLAAVKARNDTKR